MPIMNIETKSLDFICTTGKTYPRLLYSVVRWQQAFILFLSAEKLHFVLVTVTNVDPVFVATGDDYYHSLLCPIQRLLNTIANVIPFRRRPSIRRCTRTTIVSRGKTSRKTLEIYRFRRRFRYRQKVRQNLLLFILVS